MKHTHPFFALALCCASFLAWPLAQPARAQFVGPTGSGYQGANGLQYNSMQGATMSVMLQGMQNNFFARRALMNSYYTYAAYGGRSRPSAADLQRARGARLIKAGRATTKFPMRAWPAAYWMANTVKDTSVSAEEDRRIRYTGMQLQRAEWARQVKARGAKWGDMADMLAIATVIAVEVYTGDKVSNAGFEAQRRLLRQMWLKDAYFQGRSAASKQQFYESALLLGATYPWYLRNVKKDVAKAKTWSAEFLDEWYRDKTPGVMRIYAAKYMVGGPRVAKVPTPAAALAPASRPEADPSTPASPPPAALEAARRYTLYTPTAGALLPQMLAQNAAPDKRADTLKLCESLLQQGRANLSKITTPGGGQEDVADALMHAVMMFVTVSKSASSNPSEAGFTPQSLQGLNDQFTRFLGSDSKFQAQGARQKQLMFEGAILMGALTGGLNSEAQRANDPELRKVARQSAGDALRTLLGVAPDKVRVTRAGLQL